ncbi:hypothetical protein P9112_006409 [Eukaryota sp. TZLM1-RC]
MSLQELFASSDLIDREGNTVSLSSLQEKERIGLYFSASWCPPCRMFTPNLVNVYNELKSQGKSFEVVLVPSDRTEADFKEYLKKMPWLSIPFTGPAKQAISNRFSPPGIPHLVIVDNEGNEVTDEGRNHVQLKGADAWSEWQ